MTTATYATRHVAGPRGVHPTGRALELFLQSLLDRAADEARTNGRKQVTPTDLYSACAAVPAHFLPDANVILACRACHAALPSKRCINAAADLDFLRDLVKDVSEMEPTSPKKGGRGRAKYIPRPVWLAIFAVLLLTALRIADRTHGTPTAGLRMA